MTRSCRYPLDAQLQDHWLDLKELIKVASPEFYKQIADLGHKELDSQHKKIRHTVHKYFNRAKHRATPYGSFAAISVWDLQSQGASKSSRIIMQGMKTIDRMDWSLAAATTSQSIKQLKTKNWQICCQATCYRVGDQYYFYSKAGEEFELCSLQVFPELEVLLNACETPIPYKTLLAKFPETERPLYCDLIKQLLELQVLNFEGAANITGKDYFERIHNQPDLQPTPYTIAHRQTVSGYYQEHEFQELKEYIHFAQQNLNNPTASDLEIFKQEFMKKYEQTWQPLAQVLDPSLGIGFGNFNQSLKPELDSLIKPTEQASFSKNQNDEFQAFLLRNLIQSTQIRLEKFQGTTHKEHQPLANSLGALLQPTKQGLMVEAISGPTANALLARFANDEPVMVIAEGIAQLEQEANPDVLFLDIAYQAEGRVDNVNRRPQLYDGELNICGWSTHPQPILLKELLISVINNQVVLYAQKHQKRVVPRIPSAYNTSRSVLPLFRLFAALQYQGQHQQFKIDLEDFFPRLDYYPRITYQTLIIQPSKWKIPSYLIKSGSASAIKTWLTEQNIPSHIRIGQGDQYLTYRLNKESEMIDFLQYIQSQSSKTLWIQEAFEYPSDFQDTQCRQYAHQIQLAITHQQAIYQPLYQTVKPASQNRHPIGDNWLYAVLEIPENQQLNFLDKVISPFITANQDYLENWFYILYKDPKPQIRLRIKYQSHLTDGIKQQVQNQISKWENGHQYDGLQSILYKTYIPEWERYGIATMELAEVFFGLDSQMALHQHTKMNCIQTQCMRWIMNMVSYAIPDQAAQLDFYSTMAANFAKEMQWEQSAFKHINNLFKTVNCGIQTPTKIQKKQFKIWDQIQKHESLNAKILLADFIHMHVNRRHPSHPRLHEALLYQFCKKAAIRNSKLQVKHDQQLLDPSVAVA